MHQTFATADTAHRDGKQALLLGARWQDFSRLEYNVYCIGAGIDAKAVLMFLGISAANLLILAQVWKAGVRRYSGASS